jgi:hydrogenase/urease accessory protein HupE
MSRAVRPVRAAALALAVLLAPSAGHAHGLDPAALSLREVQPGEFDVEWRTSALRLPGANVQPVLPAGCRQIGAARSTDAGDRVSLHWRVDCGTPGLAGEVLRIDDLAAAKINALLTIERLDGQRVQAVLGPHSASFTVPMRPSTWGVIRDYVVLGVTHIMTGPDHLLFVFGLLLLVSASRLLVQTITAFTVGHSITLSAAALHVATVPPRPIELLIAISILVLAVELARDASRPTLLRQFPWAMALAFGLLHGFGFAGALAEAGLPAGDVPLALVSFNGGIEIGQLAFVGTVLALVLASRRWLPAVVGRSSRVVVYAMGMLSAYWCFERAAAWLG